MNRTIMANRDAESIYNKYIVKLDLNKCSDYPELRKYNKFKGRYVTRLNDTLVFDIGKISEQFIYIPYQWILWMIPDSYLE